MVVLLLILIFCVLLFGAGAVMAGFGWLAAAVVTLMALYGLIVTAAWLFVGIRDTAPKLPGGAAAFFRGYAKILCAPVVGPSGDPSPNGERAVSTLVRFQWASRLCGPSVWGYS